MPGRPTRSAAGGGAGSGGENVAGRYEPAGGTGQFPSSWAGDGPAIPSRTAWSGGFAARCRGSRRPSSCCRSPWRAHGGYGRDRARRGTRAAPAVGFRAYSRLGKKPAGASAGERRIEELVRELRRRDVVARAQDHQPLDEVPQLAHIARPRVPQERSSDLARESPTRRPCWALMCRSQYAARGRMSSGRAAGASA